MRLLHLADVHLDTLFAGRTESLRRRLREATHEALSRAVALAREEKVDAVLLAGDLFDGERLSLATEHKLLSLFRELEAAGIPLFYATGNHDPAGSLAGWERGSGGEDGNGGRSTGEGGLGSRGSHRGTGRRGGDTGPTGAPWDRTHGTARLEWPAGVHRFGSAEPRTLPVIRSGEVVGTVTAAGHEGPREERDLSRAFRAPVDREVPAVAMLHTQVGGARGGEGHDRYAPSELAFLQGAGFDYWALGHVHLRQELATSPGIHYPGNLQGRSPRETGAKGGLLVEIPGPGLVPRTTFVELAPIRWEVLELGGGDGAGWPGRPGVAPETEGTGREAGDGTGDLQETLAEARTVEQLLRLVEGAWTEARGQDPGRGGTEWILRLRLSGPSPLHRLLRDPAEAATLARQLEARLGLLEVEVRTEHLRPALDVGRALERQDAAGEALRLVRELRTPDGPSPSEVLGFEVGELADPDGDPGGLDAWIRACLQGGEAELLERFRDEA